MEKSWSIDIIVNDTMHMYMYIYLVEKIQLRVKYKQTKYRLSKEDKLLEVKIGLGL
jgi:hypothetical protein